jgi:hypothetical protein
MSFDDTITDDQYRDELPAGSRACPAQPALGPRRAWLLLLGVYAAGLADGVWGSLCTALLSLHVLSLGLADRLAGWQGNVWEGETATSLVVLMWVAWPLAEHPRAIGRLRPSLVRVLVTVGIVACVPIAAAVVHDPDWFIEHDLAWRTVQMLTLLGLIGVLAQRQAITGAEFGLSTRGRWRLDAVGGRVFAVSLLGLFGAGMCLVALSRLIVSYTQGSVTQGSESEWSWLAAVLTNAVVEETVCTALLCALLLRSGRPRWQIYTAAGVLRVAFHLYLGVGGLGAAVFAVTNAHLFLRYRRLLPLIVAHAFYDSVESFPLAPLGRLAAFGGALLLAAGLAWYRREPAQA